MKIHTFSSRLVLLAGLFFVMFMISCKKDKEVGPTGPAGPAGPKGDTGAGSSNVIYSGWLDVKFKADTLHKAGGDIDTLGYYIDIDAPLLTLEMLNTADIKVYLNSSNTDDPVIYPLPYVGTSGVNVQVSAYAGGIQLYSNADLSTFIANGKKNYQYRYMIIPGTGQARSAAPVNWSDYASVKTYLGLKD